MTVRAIRNARQPRQGAALIAAAIAMLAGYCQLRSATETGPVPVWVSMRWAIATVLPWSLASAWGWSCRAELLAAARGAGRARAQLFLSFWGAAQVIDLAAFASGRVGLFAIDTGRIAVRTVEFAPFALLLAGALTIILALVGRPRVRDGEGGAWIAFPEHLRLRADDIRLVRSAGNYCQVSTPARDHLVRLTLAELAEQLAPYGFVRVHRTAIVHPARVREVMRGTKGRRRLRLSCGTELPLGDRYRDALGALVPSLR